MPSPVPPDAHVANIRTLALVGASASGKTQLSEALLEASAAITVAGSLERGTTVSDSDPLERRHQHSLHAAVMHCQWHGCRIHLIDTPGAADFIGQSLPALEAVDTAVVVINALTGIEPMTVRMMDYAAERHLDRVILVNKIDAQGVNLPQLLTEIQTTFGKECLPLNLPDGEGTKVVDCYFNRKGHSDFGDVDRAHRALVEQVVEVDGEFVERYLNDGDIEASELHAPLEQALREGHLIPVCFISAKTGAGVQAFLDVIERLLPNPTEGNAPDFLRGEGDAAEAMKAIPDAGQHALAHVFKIMNDPYVGKLGVMRVHQGTITRDSMLFVGDARKPFKVGHLFMLQGKSHVEVEQAVPGDIVAVAKIEQLHFDAVLHDASDDAHIHLAPLPFPKPVHGLAIAPKRRGDEQRLWELMAKLLDEDPCLRLEQVASTHETVVYGLSELHLRLLLERMQDAYKFEVETSVPKVAYRETITVPAEGHYRHKKQSGGAGQFGEVFLKVEPLTRGTGFEFVDAVKGGTIPGQFMPAVEKGIREALDSGVLSGHPVVDLRVVVYDGKHHSVDSKEIAFVIAGRRAFQTAILAASPVLLEPIVDLEIQIPATTTGDITGDLASRRGMVNGTEPGPADTMQVRGQAPLAELMSYQTRLNAMTSGQGRYSLAMSHYEVAPSVVQQQLAASFKLRQED